MALLICCCHGNCRLCCFILLTTSHCKVARLPKGHWTSPVNVSQMGQREKKNILLTPPPPTPPTQNSYCTQFLLVNTSVREGILLYRAAGQNHLHILLFELPEMDTSVSLSLTFTCSFLLKLQPLCHPAVKRSSSSSTSFTHLSNVCAESLHLVFVLCVCAACRHLCLELHL